jgi:hypothetical protein
MPSIGSSVANVQQGSKFFVVITQLAATDILSFTNGVIASISNANLTGRLAPGAVLRDMGVTVRIPPTNSTSTNQETLRKVQLIDPSALTGSLVAGLPPSFVNYNEGAGGLPTFYVRVEPNRSGSGPVCVASLGI